MISDSHTLSTRSAAWGQIRAGLASDWPLHAIILGYAVAAIFLGLALGAPERVVLTLYVPVWLTGTGTFGLLYLLVRQVPVAVAGGSRRPLTDSLRTMLATFGPRLVPGCMLTLSMALFFGSFTSIKNMLPLMVPFWFDKPLADLGLMLHAGRSPWSLLQGLIGDPAITRAIEFCYEPVWLVLLTGLPALFAFHPRLGRLRTRYFLAMFLCFVLLGNVAAAIGMSAGPAFYGHVTGDHERLAEITQYLSFSAGRLHSAHDLQAYLWESFSTGRVQLGTGISAFPSLHVAMATLFALAGRQVDRRLGLMLAAFAGIILVGCIHLGWHYSLDGYVAVLGSFGMWHLAGRIQRRFRLDDEESGSASIQRGSAWDSAAANRRHLAKSSDESDAAAHNTILHSQRTRHDRPLVKSGDARRRVPAGDLDAYGEARRRRPDGA